MGEEIEAAAPALGRDEISEAVEGLVETVDEQPLESAEPAVDDVAADLPEGVDPNPDPLAEIDRRLSELTEQAARYHERAAQRESVIDVMHAELEQLRLGERRSLLRPLLTEVSRARDDLLRQAETLPEPFDRERAAELLRSFAGSLELALEDNGVTSFLPEVGEPFQARLHRAAGKSPTHEEAMVGTVAEVVSPGYRDIDADVVIATARVVVHVADQSIPEAPASA
jgi:molecular chaperone GrpE